MHSGAERQQRLCADQREKQRAQSLFGGKVCQSWLGKQSLGQAVSARVGRGADQRGDERNGVRKQRQM